MAVKKYKYPVGKKETYMVTSKKISGGMLEFKNKKKATQFNALLKKGY